jgi:hypothetical protein
MRTLLFDIEAFLGAHNLSQWQFGEEAVNDRHFVEDLRAGRRCWPETEVRVRLYMDQFGKAAA